MLTNSKESSISAKVAIPLRDTFWIPILKEGQRNAFNLSLIPTGIVTASFIFWWLTPSHHISIFRSVVATFLCSFELIIPAYFYFFVRRMKMADPRLNPAPEWRVAMVVTKAPSEPWETVKRTLEAMLGQCVPHDTWLADEDPTEETMAWCQSKGVSVSTRKNVPNYHRQSWPRRTRCKEGNLAFFYDTYGYERYDFVAQLDADHIPDPNYLREILRPFHNPLIGYVAAPSICDNNKISSWAARGRLYAEATLHGPLQAGYNDRWAPLCIGSHYAVRTSALRAIGGLGPELAEDHSTSLMMNANNWHGAFQINAIAHGDGPATFSDCMTQEFQWSRSLTMILFQWTPKLWAGLTLRHKVQFLFSELWYPLFSSVAFIGFLVPIFCLLFDKPLVNINYFTFMGFATLLVISNTIPAVLLKRFGCLRPHDARVISWEEPLFTITRFPWVLCGILNGVFTIITRRQLTFRVTPKGSLTGVPLRTRSVSPYLIISASFSLVVILASNVRAATGYYYLSLLSSGIITAAMLLVIHLHHLETGTRRRQSARSITAALSAFGLLLAASGLRLNDGLAGITQSTASAEGADKGFLPVNATLAPNEKHSTVTGIDCPGKPCFGVYDANGAFSTGNSAVQINHFFIPWGIRHAAEISSAIASSAQQGRIPLITLEPWPWAVITVGDKDMQNYKQIEAQFNKTLLGDIAEGKYDDSIISSFKEIARYPRQHVLVRLMHEMEMTKQYPWYSENSHEYIHAYRHVIVLSRKLKIKNVQWVWSPVGLEKAALFWPGDSYVDYVGLSIYATPEWNWGHAPKGENLSFETLVQWKYWIKKFKKPIILAEVGVTGSPIHKQEWMKQASKSLAKFPEVIAWIYFNQQQPPIVTLDIGLPDWSLSELDAREVTKMLRSDR